MPNWLLEVWYVISMSKRTRWAIILGVVSFIGINLLGEIMLANYEPQGPIKSYLDTLTHKIMKRYDKAALISLVGCLVLAYKLYQKDKKRFW